jgi:hypothetical protein
MKGTQETFMSPEPTENTNTVRRVVLPSGKAIDVVYFGDQTAAPASRRRRPDEELHMCGSCGSELVYPLDWEESGATHWEVALRCPNCEWMGTGVYPQETVERFDEELDRGTEALVRDLKQLMHANMEDEIDRFVRALDGGHIVPDDF